MNIGSDMLEFINLSKSIPLTLDKNGRKILGKKLLGTPETLTLDVLVGLGANAYSNKKQTKEKKSNSKGYLKQ